MRPADPLLTRDGVTLRLLRRRDEAEWLALRDRNRDWLRPWEATPPPGKVDKPVTYARFIRRERAAWNARRAFPFAIEYEGRLAGRCSLSRIEWGSERGGSAGYWVSRDLAGRGIAPTALVLLAEYAFAEGLHRIEVAVRPENHASLAVTRKLELREEGMRASYLFIDGAWRDHRVFAITAAEKRRGRWWTGVEETVAD